MSTSKCPKRKKQNYRPAYDIETIVQVKITKKKKMKHEKILKQIK